jgi:plastocyanin
MKKLLVVLMILFVGILLCGCTSQPATTPTTTAAPTVAPTPVVSAEPTTVAVNATPAPVNTTAKPTATPTPQIVVTIKLTNYNTVDPAGTIIVKAGTKVVWVNQMMARENLIKSTGLYEGLFKSGALYSGDSFSYTFDKAGTYDWMSTTNGAFKGTITVQ